MKLTRVNLMPNVADLAGLHLDQTSSSYIPIRNDSDNDSDANTRIG